MSSAGGRPSWQTTVSVATSIVPPGPCPPPSDTPDASPFVTTSQVTASLRDFAVSLLGEGVEPADAVAGSGGQVGADGAEGLGAGHGAHAAGDLDAQLAHPDDLFCFIVIRRNPQVMGEPEIVIGAVAHPGGQSVPFSLQLAAAG